MGLLEYLEMAEQVHAQPLLAVWAGYTLNGTVVPQAQLQPYVQEALDEIHMRSAAPIRRGARSARPTATRRRST
jgi:hypothetical protein